MSVDVAPAPTRAAWLTVRLACALISSGAGRLADSSACSIALETCGERRPGQRVREAMRPLLADDVVVHVDGVWYAPNVADLGAWLADALEAREDAGVLASPVIPAARSAAA